MQEQSSTPKGLQQLKARVEHLKVDATDALHAARHDFEEVLSAVREIRAHSEVKAFVQSRLKNGNGHADQPTQQKPATPKADS